MAALRRFFLRLAALFRRGRAEAELAREIQSHLRLLEDQFVARGMRVEDARFAARRAFGGRVEQAKERQRDERSFRWIDESWLDLKLGPRMAAKSPGLTAIAVVALSVAIGGGAAYLEFLNDLVRPTVPGPHGRRIVGIQPWNVATGQPDNRPHDAACALTRSSHSGRNSAADSGAIGSAVATRKPSAANATVVAATAVA